MEKPPVIHIEVSDPLKALSTVVEIMIQLRYWNGVYEANPSEENRKGKIHWEDQRDRWISKHRVKEYQNTELKNINMEFVQMTAVRVRRVNRRSEEQKALDIIDMVASYYQVDKSLFYKRFKPRYISERKHMILWLLRKHTKLNVVQIGKLLGIHYSIVSTGSRNFLNLMDIDSNYKKEVREIEAQIL